MNVDSKLGSAAPPPASPPGEPAPPRPSGLGSDSAGGRRVPAVSVADLSKVYLPSPAWMKVLLKSAIQEPVVALDDVSFTLERGETCVVVGPNGAGKSTLFRVLTGLTTATSGEARILGHDVNAGRRVRSLIGYMPAEDRNLMLRHTCFQNLAFRGKLQSIPRSELADRADEALDQVGILHARDRAATSLSTGMKARLQLAAALLHRPDVLILDEPTAAIDPVGAHELLTLIEQLTAEHGLSIILSSHRLEEIDALRNNVVFLDHGRVIHNGKLDELRQLWEQPIYRIELDATVDAATVGIALDRRPEFDVDVVANTIEVTTEQPVGSVLAAIEPVLGAVVHFDRVVMPLRALFHKLVSDRGAASREGRS